MRRVQTPPGERMERGRKGIDRVATVKGTTTAEPRARTTRTAPSTPISDAPKLVVSKRIRRTPEAHDPQREYQFLYLDKHHAELPHVVKFSCGRSSGMLLLTLLANSILKSERGDVVPWCTTRDLGQ